MAEENQAQEKQFSINILDQEKGNSKKSGDKHPMIGSKFDILVYHESLLGS
jgi:hypothetical protein